MTFPKHFEDWRAFFLNMFLQSTFSNGVVATGLWQGQDKIPENIFLNHTTCL